MPPGLIIALTFVALMAVGTALLAFPSASKAGKSVGFVNAMFLSVSAVSTTGLTTLNVPVEFTLYGKIVLLLLVQLGGLGFVTISAFLFTILGAKIGLNQRFLLKEALNQTSIQGVVKMGRRIIIFTFGLEGIGALLNLIVFAKDYPIGQAVFYSIFHAVSAFNHAGLIVIPDMMRIYTSNVLLNLVTAALVILGSIGFIVYNELCEIRHIRHISAHTKIVVGYTAALLMIGMFALKIAEGDKITWLQAFFQSMTARTAGFDSIDILALSPASTAVLMFLMYIGGAPCSTAGGIKVITLFVLIRSMVAFSFGKKPRVGCRTIADSSVLKAFMVLLWSASMIFIVAVLILLTSDFSVEKVIFECISAFSTTGLSSGITVGLNDFAKIILCFLMFIGRLGPLTIMSKWGKSKSDENVRYVEEKFIIG